MRLDLGGSNEEMIAARGREDHGLVGRCFLDIAPRPSVAGLVVCAVSLGNSWLGKLLFRGGTVVNTPGTGTTARVLNLATERV